MGTVSELRKLRADYASRVDWYPCAQRRQRFGDMLSDILSTVDICYLTASGPQDKPLLGSAQPKTSPLRRDSNPDPTA
jgi:hypothetical protein